MSSARGSWTHGVICSLLLFGCKREPAVEVRRDDVIRPSTSAVRPEPKPLSDFRYATSTTGEVYTPGGPELFLSMAGIRLKPDGPLVVPHVGGGDAGFASKYKKTLKEYELELAPLRAALDALTPKHLLMHVDNRVTYRMLVEVIFTGGMSGVAQYTFVVEDAKGVHRGIVIVPPKSGSIPSTLFATGSLCGPGPIGLGLTVTPDGFSVNAAGSPIALGCATLHVGPSKPTVPTVGGSQDFSGLRACLVKLHDCDPSRVPESLVLIGATPATTFQTVISTWDAVRRRDNGKPFLVDIAMTIVS